MRRTQREMILAHLKERGSITSYEAFREYGCTRLSHVIWILKKDGCEFEDETIKSLNRYGDKIHFKRYTLIGQKGES